MSRSKATHRSAVEMARQNALVGGGKCQQCRAPLVTARYCGRCSDAQRDRLRKSRGGVATRKLTCSVCNRVGHNRKRHQAEKRARRDGRAS